MVSQNLLQAIQEEDTESTIDYTSEISELSITLGCSLGESDSLNTIADNVTEEIEELQNLIESPPEGIKVGSETAEGSDMST